MPHAHASGFPSPVLAQSNARGGQAPALREHRDQEVSPTGVHRDQEVSPTGGMMTFASGPNTFDNLTDFVVLSQQIF